MVNHRIPPRHPLLPLPAKPGRRPTNLHLQKPRRPQVSICGFSPCPDRTPFVGLFRRLRPNSACTPACMAYQGCSASLSTPMKCRCR